MAFLKYCSSHTDSFRLREISNILMESILVDALMRQKPLIHGHPARADEVIYDLCGILLMVQHLGLMCTNKQFCVWQLGEKTMSFAYHHQHVFIRLIDFGPPQ